MFPKIYIGQLSPDTTEDDLTRHFSKLGRVTAIDLIKSINGKDNAGYAYIRMSNSRETDEVIAKLNNSELKGKRITVMQAHNMDQDNWHIPYRFRRRRGR